MVARASSSSPSSPSPTWIVKDEGSFASVSVVLPPNTSIHCESDAVVSMSQSVTVRGILSGGLLAGFARIFLTRESFFTTKVENTSMEASGDVLIAPSDPGGIALHKLRSESVMDDMFLTSGAYLAADEGVHVDSTMQGQFGNSLLSGTGFFLLHASGRGNLAISAYGSMHKFVLTPGQTRMVDNGHLVAWTASMKYKMKFATSRGGILGSMTSGEGLHCEFEGPGVLYIQSHKPENMGVGKAGNSSRPRSGGAGGGAVCACFAMLFIIVTFGIVAGIFLFAGLEGFKSITTNGPSIRYQYHSSNTGRQQRQQHGNNGRGNRGQNEYYEGDL